MNTISNCGCGSTDISRCGGSLPDQPECAINYHFGMLLGVDDFRAEQGFHVGQHRRHQHVLHGWGVVYGFGVAFLADRQEIRVEPGHAIDRRGRDLVIGTAQCLGLPAWWEQQRQTDVFADIPNKDDATFDADVLLCYRTCLSRPVPAIADPCAEQAADIAYSRICEQAQLTLVRRTTDAPPPGSTPPYRLLRRLAGLAPAEAADPDDAWLDGQLATLATLPGTARDAAEAALWRAVAARAAAATAEPTEAPAWAPSPDPDGIEDRTDCIVIARLSGIHLQRTDDGWTMSVASLTIDGRQTLLPTQALQALLPAEAEPAMPAAGPVIEADSAAIAGSDIALTFDKPLAPASATPAAFAATEFVAATGWAPFTIQTVALSNGDRTVTLSLDRAPAGVRVRVTAFGRGTAPLLGADFIPVGAPSADADGTDLSITLPRSGT